MDHLLIGVVGNCTSGKTTLVRGLNNAGYRAVNIPQEHSVSPRFWRRLKVDFLVMLSCSLETARQRRQIPWGQERLDAQAEKLADARINCQLFLPTDNLTIEEVLAMVIDAIKEFEGGKPNVREDHALRPQASSQSGGIYSSWA